jgi:hypothetical protein
MNHQTSKYKELVKYCLQETMFFGGGLTIIWADNLIFQAIGFVIFLLSFYVAFGIK